MTEAQFDALDEASGIHHMEYRKPPIVEAVVQVSFEERIDLADVERIAGRFSKLYASRNERQAITASLDTATGKLSATNQKIGVELRDDLATKVLVIDADFVLFSALAPYGGWSALEVRLVEELEGVKSTVGPLKVSRLGMRFVNRIDVKSDGRQPNYGGYVNAQPSQVALPDIPMFGFLVQVTQPLPMDGGSYTLTCGSAESPLPGYFAISVDIDVSVTRPMALNLRKIQEVLREMRTQKNRLFESVITDEARKIFGVIP